MTEIICADSVTVLDARHRGNVLVGGSHGGIYAGYLAAKAGVRAVILHNAGVGKDQAGLGSLAYLDGIGMPAAVLGHMTARIADGQDQLARGIISHVNEAAEALGCRVGESCQDCARRMAGAGQWQGSAPAFGESRFLLRARDGEPQVWGVDSTSLVRPEDKGAVMITASHGAIFGSAENKPIAGPPLAVIFNDAGVGADDCGVARLPALDGEGVIAATVGAATARIGDARSAWESGIISHANALAEAAGIMPGDNLEAFADKAIARGQGA
ncbi:MAG: hypothetical protein HOM52_17670 [Rhodospirillaceae bacterium]|nr:hypothetical protein [Rhodospirillaceae bacterium]MBT3925863.1 hypothetical protein [Rhodospirillaceae bacterium]MBT5040337.1 hypothetical protein [Rhodospirillaceae bacterium]MBT5677168.1 hypothetical protein [Rhodospirillaceae bacterium]MBT5778226.1 hypothetical protein [Rhodospirillaceae bacterium]